MKSIFEYLDFRAYLTDYYQEQKEKKPYFTHRYFCKKAGLSSPMHLKLVMTGKRNLTHKTIPKFARGLELKKRDAEYFENLVYFCQSKTPDEKTQFLQKMESFRLNPASRTLIHKEQMSLYSQWYFVLIYELVATQGFTEDPQWIASRIGDGLRAIEVRKALQLMIETGLLVRDEEGRLKQASPIVRSADETEDLRVREFQKRMIARSLSRIDDPIDLRQFGAVTVASNPEQFQRVKELAKEFMREANRILTRPEPGERVYQLNLQFFQVTQSELREPKSL